MEFKEIKSRSLWNSFVESFSEKNIPRSTFMQSFEWVEFQRSIGNEAYTFGIIHNQKLIAAAASVIIKAKRGKYIYIRNGPVLDWSNKVLVEFLIKKIKDFAKTQKLWFIRLSPLIETGSEENNILKNFKGRPNPMNEIDALDTWILDARMSEEELLKIAKKKYRYEIRKALSTGENGLNLKTEITDNPLKVNDFYDILKNTIKRQKWNAYSLNYIKNEFEIFSKQNKATLVLVKKDNVNIAGGIFIHFANQSTYHYGASLSEFSNIPGAYRVIWEGLRLAKKRNMSFLNLWGIAPENQPNHPWNGLSKFKMKFPGFAQRWTHSIDLPISLKYNLTNAFERIDKYRKGY